MDSCSSSPGSGSSSLSLEDKSVSVIWGCELNDRTRKCVVEEDDDLLEHVIYLRTVSLGEDADDEPHVIAVESKNMASVPKPVTIASLCHSILPMVSLDGLELIPPVTFFLKSGTGPVYLNGHHLTLDDDSDYDSSDHEHSSEEADEDDLDHSSLEDEEELATAESQTRNILGWPSHPYRRKKHLLNDDALLPISSKYHVELCRQNTTDTGVPLDVYRADPSPQKVCLGHAGCLTDHVDQVWIPPVVQRILLQIPQDPTLDHEYLPELGMTEFTRAAVELIIGKNSHALLENRAGGIQTIGGPGAVWIAAEFLHRWYKPTESTPATIYIAVPQLGDFGCIFQVAGFTDIRSYHYWDSIKLAVDTEGFLEKMQSAPEGSVVFLHAPEEMGLAPQDWEKVAAVMQKRHLFPFFEIAAQGLASGNLDKDAWTVRYFLDNGFELLCAQSFSKIFGLYDERVGNLIVVTKDNETLIRIQSQVAKLIAMSWFCPTNLGGRVIAMVLTCPALRYEWVQSLQALVKRIMLIREKLKEKLRILGTPGSWEHLTAQSGVFSFIGLLPSQVEFLAKQKHIYLFPNGQINLCSINSKNLDYVTQSIHEAVVATTLQDRRSTENTKKIQLRTQPMDLPSESSSDS